MYRNNFKIWFVFITSTIILIFGIVSSIIFSSSYLSPLGNNYAIEELNRLDKLIYADKRKLSQIFIDEKISKKEKEEINKFNSLKYYEGKIKFIIQTRDRKTLYTIGSIISLNKNPISIYEKIGKQSINFVAYFKALFYKNIINDCNNYLRNPYTFYQDKIEVYEIQCAFNLNKSMMRIYKGDKFNTSYIISRSIPIANEEDKVIGVIQIASDASQLEKKLGIILISILSPVIFSIVLVSLFIFYLQYFLSTKVKSNWINAKNIAHNLKNKTNAIKFYANKKGSDINSYKNNLIKINGIIDSLNNFIESTLDTAKIEHYGKVINKEYVNINLEEILSIIKNLYVSKNVIFLNTLNYSIAGEKNKLVEAISAVIDNSLYWNLVNTNIEISIHENKEFIDLMVMDRGPGIKDKDKKSVFKKNYSKSGGTGIGLYIAKKILVSYGGNLYAVDREGGGLIMVFKLKISKN